MLPLLQTPDTRCNVNVSFSAQIAFYFLNQQGISAKFTPIGDLQFGEKVFKVLRFRPGGYHRAKSGGSQILLNYRATAEIAPRVSLTQILQNQLNPAYVKDKIVLIGVTASGGKIAGLRLTAQMFQTICQA